jgi:hypothetical protein
VPRQRIETERKRRLLEAVIDVEDCRTGYARPVFHNPRWVYAAEATEEKK